MKQLFDILNLNYSASCFRKVP